MKITQRFNLIVLLSIFILGIPVTLFSQTGFVSAYGAVLIDEAKEIYRIKGIGFANSVWSNPSLPIKTHHSEEDFRKVQEMGFNTIRFYLNYGLFESDSEPYQYKESGFSWIDQNIVWAKKYGIRLILDMHYAQGGNQSYQQESTLWSDADNQKRLVSLWGEIARRYALEPTVLAYSLLNEPVLTHSFGEYGNLLKQIIKRVRKEDTKHLLIVEKAQFIWGEYKENRNLNFVKVRDSNVLYAFHFFDPVEYTLQNALWLENTPGFSSFPNYSRFVVCGEEKWEKEMDNYAVPKKNENTQKGEWVFVESPLEMIPSQKYAFGVPVFKVKKLGVDGKAWANGFQIKEFDKDKKLLKTIVYRDSIDKGGWYYWSYDKTGLGQTVEMAYQSNKSLFIEGCVEVAIMGTRSFQFPLKKGHYYQVSGYVKGSNLSKKSELQLGFELYSIKGDILPFDKSYLSFRINRYIDWSKKNKVPIYLAEFGTIADSFSRNRGGLLWVNDVLDICNLNNLGFSYHNYHEENSFGVFRSPVSQIPSQGYTPLIMLFKRKLKEGE